MKCSYALYLDENSSLKKQEILKKLDKDEWQLEKYLIVLSKNEKNHLEIFNSVLLLQKAIDKDDLFLVGIAGGYQEALELIEQITRNVYDETKGTDIRNYIIKKQQEYEKGSV